MKKNEIFVTTWMDLEDIMLKKMSGREILYDFTYMWNLENKINEQAKQKQTYTYREQTNACQKGAGRAEWGRGGEGIKMYKLAVTG